MIPYILAQEEKQPRNIKVNCQAVRGNKNQIFLPWKQFSKKKIKIILWIQTLSEA